MITIIAALSVFYHILPLNDVKYTQFVFSFVVIYRIFIMIFHLEKEKKKSN